MAQDPAFLFYPGDYLRDTQCLSEKAQVAYDRIMCEHMRNISLDVSKIVVSRGKVDFFIKRLSDEEKKEVMHVLTDINGSYQIDWVAISISKRKFYTESRAKNRTAKNKKDMNSYDVDKENEIVISSYNTEKLEKMIVQEMMKVWMANKPKYKSDKELDYSACLDIAYFIADDLGIEKNKVILLGNTTNLNDLLIIDKWEQILKFIVTDPFFNKLTISAISNKKNWQSVLNGLEYVPPKSKAEQLETKRTTHEEYFENEL